MPLSLSNTIGFAQFPLLKGREVWEYQWKYLIFLIFFRQKTHFLGIRGGMIKMTILLPVPHMAPIWCQLVSIKKVSKSTKWHFKSEIWSALCRDRFLRVSLDGIIDTPEVIQCGGRMTKDSFLFSSVLAFSLHFFQCQNLNLTSNGIHQILSLVQQIHSVVVLLNCNTYPFLRSS